jgi:hypothetical protein
MSDYINDSLLSSKPLQKQRDNAKALVGKWSRTGLLDGLDKEWDRSSMAQLLENQARQLISEVSRTSPSGGSVGSSYKGDEEWSGVALPLVRRIFGEIAAQDFVSVQPMNLPSGLVFYLDFQYGSNRMNKIKDGSLAGDTGKYSPSGSSAPYPKGGFYGAGRHGYTVATGSETIGSITSANASWKDVNFDTELSSSVNAGNIFKATVTTANTDWDKLAVRSTHFTSGSVSSQNPAGEGFPGYNSQGVATGSINRFFPELFSITGEDAATGTLTLIYSASAAADVVSSTMTAHYPKFTTEAARGDFEDTGGNATQDSLAIPEVNLNLKSRPIVAKTRKLKAVWTPELAQDLNAYHSVDAEAELTSMLSEYISMEIDLEILDMLISDASTVDYWSAKQGNDFDAGADGGTGAFVNTTFYGTRFEWYQTLVQKVTKVSNEIHRLTLRGGANFVVCSPKVSTILESLPGYNSSPGADASVQQYAMGVTKIGAVDGRYSVYKNPYMDENTILIGFKGGSFLETGAVYAPYVPLIMTPLVYDPSDFTPRKGVMTRYAKKMIRPEFYAKIYVADLNLI